MLFMGRHYFCLAVTRQSVEGCASGRSQEKTHLDMLFLRRVLLIFIAMGLAM